MVHTAALAACSADTPPTSVASRASESAAARAEGLRVAQAVYALRRAERLKVDAQFFEHLIAAAGRAGSLRAAVGFLDDMARARVPPRSETFAAAVLAAVACGDRAAAARLLDAALAQMPHREPPGANAFTGLIAAHARAGDLPAAVRTLEQLVAAGRRPTRGTITALVGACQRAARPRLAFAAAAAARAGGVAVDDALGLQLARAAFNAIRQLWLPGLGYPLPLSERELRAAAAAAAARGNVHVRLQSATYDVRAMSLLPVRRHQSAAAHKHTSSKAIFALSSEFGCISAS